MKRTIAWIGLSSLIVGCAFRGSDAPAPTISPIVNDVPTDFHYRLLVDWSDHDAPALGPNLKAVRALSREVRISSIRLKW